MFFWRLLMPDDLPSGDKAVYVFIEMIALGFVLYSIEEAFKDNPSWAKVLIAIALGLVFFLVGIKWVSLKSRLWPTLTNRIDKVAGDYRYRYGFLLIALFFISGWLLLYLRALRADLDTYVMPRTLSEQQLRQISSVLMGHNPGMQIDVFVSTADGEAISYALKIVNIIKRCGWDARLQTLNPWEEGPSTKHYGGAFYNIYLATESGVSVRVAGESQHQSDPLHPSAEAYLREALQKAEILTGGGGSAQGSYAVMIEVGKRPYEIRRTTVRSQIGQWIMRNWIMVPR
jgi:hypothetical protein